MTYSNQEIDAIAEVTDSLDPWLVRFEEAFTEALPQPQVAEFDRDARIRHDIRTRYQVYREARDTGILNVDEIRELEDREPLPKPVNDSDYDGADFTPLLIQIAAARGLATELGTGPEDAPNPESAKTALPGTPLPAVKMPAAAVNGNGQHT